MSPAALQKIFGTLNQHKVKYLLVGGLACAAHGYVRATMDLDLAVALDRENATRAIQAFCALGYKPMAPVDAADFADLHKREQWIREKNLLVFQMVSPALPDTSVDIFIAEPFDFETEYAKAPRMEIFPGMEVPVVTLRQLVAMKEKAGRPKDMQDVLELRSIEQKPRQQSQK